MSDAGIMRIKFVSHILTHELADDTKRMPGLQLNSDSEHSSVQFASSGAEWESSEEFDGAHLTDEGK